jgi:hypothetical protein
LQFSSVLSRSPSDTSSNDLFLQFWAGSPLAVSFEQLGYLELESIQCSAVQTQHRLKTKIDAKQRSKCGKDVWLIGNRCKWSVTSESGLHELKASRTKCWMKVGVFFFFLCQSRGSIVGCVSIDWEVHSSQGWRGSHGIGSWIELSAIVKVSEKVVNSFQGISEWHTSLKESWLFRCLVCPIPCFDLETAITSIESNRTGNGRVNPLSLNSWLSIGGWLNRKLALHSRPNAKSKSKNPKSQMD